MGGTGIDEGILVISCMGLFICFVFFGGYLLSTHEERKERREQEKGKIITAIPKEEEKWEQTS